jgi:hypothetical protein
LHHLLRQPRHGLQAVQLGPDGSLPLLQHPQLIHNGPQASALARQHVRQSGDAPFHILVFKAQQVLPFAELVPLGEGNHLLDGLGRKHMLFHSLQNRLVHLGHGDAQPIGAGAIVPTPTADVFSHSSVLAAARFHHQPAAAQATRGEARQ